MDEYKMAFNVTEAAKAIGVSRPTMHQLCRLDGFPAARVGGRIIIPVDKLKKWLEQQAEVVG